MVSHGEKNNYSETFGGKLLIAENFLTAFAEKKFMIQIFNQEYGRILLEQYLNFCLEI